MNTEKIPLDLNKKKYSYNIRAAKNGYIATKYMKGFQEEYIFEQIIDMLKFIANSLTGRCKSE